MYDFTKWPHASMFVVECFQDSFDSFIVWDMLVYNDLTSMVAMMVLCGNDSRSKMVCKKWLVSLMYDGSALHSGLRWKSMNEESLSVGESHPDMIGLPGFPGL